MKMKQDDANKLIEREFFPIIEDSFIKLKDKYQKYFCTDCKGKLKCTPERLGGEVLHLYMSIFPKVFENIPEYLRADRAMQREGTMSFSSGDSMLPTFKDGGMMLLLPIKFIKKEDIKIGDIVEVLYTEKNQKTGKLLERGVFVHRVINIENNQYETKGDNNKFSDGWISIKEIVGIVVGYIPCANDEYNGKDCVLLRMDLIKNWICHQQSIIKKHLEWKEKEKLKQ